MGQRSIQLAFEPAWSLAGRVAGTPEKNSPTVGRRQKIRKFIRNNPDGKLQAQFRNAGIDRIEIERTRDEVRVMMYVARPGLIIGKKGQDVEKLQEELQSLIGRRVNLKIEEISRPEVQAQLVADVSRTS